MFDKERFINDCISATGEGQGAIRELVAEAVADPAGMAAGFGPPTRVGLTPLYRSSGLTIIHFVWAPCMSLMPHNHQMYSVVGIYDGREDNLLWRRNGEAIEAFGAISLGRGDVVTLPPDAIHSVLNPIGKMTQAIHVYGGDFFTPAKPRSQWEHETLTEGPWDMVRIRELFADAERRFATGRD